MERNWLIRTAQNQILGPVAKQKLLEFIQKGALGLMDEVSSGNGYWFALKEKDLVEKYLYGDLPQSYNPISESKSVLSKRENPDKTTSINTAPANKTQLIKSTPGEGVAPSADDLEFPDLTFVRTVPIIAAKDDGVKLPDDSDLEFPDMAMVASTVAHSFKESSGPQMQAEVALAAKPMPVPKSEPLKSVSAQSSHSSEEVVFPNEDDLAFPDMVSDKTSTKVEKGKVDLDQQYTRTVALDQNQRQNVFEEDEGEDLHFSLTLDVPQEEPIVPIIEEEIHQDPSPKIQPLSKKDRQPPEERKLLYERKPKSSKSGAAQRDPYRELAHKDKDGNLEPIKRRNDNYLFFILVIIILIIVAVFFYFKEILNKPLPV